MTKLAFIFKTAPHGTAISREGLDALLAATAFCNEDEIAVFFIDEGVFNLLNHQQPEQLLQKDFISTFKLLDLYEIENRFVCKQSLSQFGLDKLSTTDFIIECQPISRHTIINQLQSAVKILTF